MVRIAAVGLSLLLVVAACGDDDGFTTTTAATSTTSAPATTTTTETPTTTAPTTTAPTTTTDPASAFEFRMDGLGVADFGDGPNSVIAAMTAIFGPPIRDTGWIVEPLCPGPMTRVVDFGDTLFDFQLLFTTGDFFAPAGTQHFNGYSYNGDTPVPVAPPELTVGTTTLELQALYPEVTFQASPFFDDEKEYYVDGPGHQLLYGRIEGTGPDDEVISVSGGVGCGE